MCMNFFAVSITWEQIMKTLEAVGFRAVPTSITLETQMDFIRYVSCCSENLSKSLKREFICILKNCTHTFYLSQLHKENKIPLSV